MSMEHGFSSYTEIVTSQRSTEFVLQVAGLELSGCEGKQVLDLGSGFRQQLARDLEEHGGQVVSLDPNLPHSDEYVLHNLENELNSRRLQAAQYAQIAQADYIDELLMGASLELELEEKARAYFEEYGIKPANNKAEQAQQLAGFYRHFQDWPVQAYGKAVAGLGTALPFADRSFDLVIATTSVPYALPRTAIPDMLAEANRVLKKGGNALFYPMVSGGTAAENYVGLPEIRSELKKARANVVSKEEKARYAGFGLEVIRFSALISEMHASGVPQFAERQNTDTLKLTRKTT